MTCVSLLLCVHWWHAGLCLKQSETSVHVWVATILSVLLKTALVEDFQAHEGGSQGGSPLLLHPPINWVLFSITTSSSARPSSWSRRLPRYTVEDWPLLERRALAEMPLVPMPMGWWAPVPSTTPASPGCFNSSVSVLEERKHPDVEEESHMH